MIDEGAGAEISRIAGDVVTRAPQFFRVTNHTINGPRLPDVACSFHRARKPRGSKSFHRIQPLLQRDAFKRLHDDVDMVGHDHEIACPGSLAVKMPQGIYFGGLLPQ
ncbi:MAG: hypothetical protein Q8M07_03785 [Prosthecobacter sp.]|nr:hypothetical protein [Prosthecobacter sp.]